MTQKQRERLAKRITESFLMGDDYIATHILRDNMRRGLLSRKELTERILAHLNRAEKRRKKE